MTEANFNFYLNQQGIQGRKGDQGDQGFSPIITLYSDTPTEYILQIENEDGTFLTPNLRNQITDQGGTYVRYIPEIGYVLADPDVASESQVGMIRIATQEDVNNNSEDTALSPALSKDLIADQIKGEGSINVTNDPETREVTISYDDSEIEAEIAELDSKVSKNARDISNLDTRITVETQLRQSQDTALDNKISNLRSDLTTEQQVRLAADQQQQVAIDAERSEREAQDSALQTQLNGKLTVDNIKQGENITITRSGNNVTISSTGGGGGTGDVTAAGDNVFTGTNLFKGSSNLRVGNDSNVADVAKYSTEFLNVTGSEYEAQEQLVIGSEYFNTVLEGLDVYKRIWNTETERLELAPVLDPTMVDNQTIKFDEGVLKADLSEIGDELNSLGGRVSSLEEETTTMGGDIEALKSDVSKLQLYKFPNMTIIGEPTINNGQISGFSRTNYLQFPFEFRTLGRTWRLRGSFRTGEDITTQQNQIDSKASVALAVRNSKLVMALSTNGTTFNLGEVQSTDNLMTNTNYYFIIEFTGSQYILSLSTNKETYTQEASITSSDPIASTIMTISSADHPYGDIINLNDWDLTVGNLLVWQGMDDVGIASRMDVNASNITEAGIAKLKEALGLGVIEDLIDAINVNYDSSSTTSLAATPMMLSLYDTTELDVENSFTSSSKKAVFSQDLDLPKNSIESYEDDTDIDLGGNA